MAMRGFSLTQPWATLVAIGAKRIETRSWSTPYRGELLIHAAKGFPRDCQALCLREPFLTPLVRAGFNTVDDLPRGAIVAVGRVRNVWSTDGLTIIHAMRPEGFDELLTDTERAFGNYAPGRFGWVFADVKRIAPPIPCKGALGLWPVPHDVLDLVMAQPELAR